MILKDAPSGITLDMEKMESELRTCFIILFAPFSTLYAGERFQLQFRFCDSYPFESPEVINYNH